MKPLFLLSALAGVLTACVSNDYDDYLDDLEDEYEDRMEEREEWWEDERERREEYWEDRRDSGGYYRS